MKHRTIRSFLARTLGATVCAAALAGCSSSFLSPDSGPGAGQKTDHATVVFTADGGSRAATDYSVLAITELRLYARKEGSDYTETFAIEYAKDSGLFRSRPLEFSPGLWHFRIDALNGDKTVTFSGSKDQTLEAGASVSIRIILLQTEYPADPAGSYVLDMSFGRFANSGEFVALKTVALAPDGGVFAYDEVKQTIQLHKPDGTIAAVFSDSYENPVIYVYQMTVAADGSLWYTSEFYNAVCRIKADGSGGWIRSKFNTLNGTDKLSKPEGIAVSASGKTFVNDSGNARIVVCSGDFVFEKAWAVRSETESASDFSPKTLSVRTDPADGKTYVYALDASRSKVRVYDEDGSILKTISVADSLAGTPSSFACDAAGRLFVSRTKYSFISGYQQKAGGGVSVYSPDGTLLLGYADLGSGAGQLDDPSSIAVSADGSKVLVGDTDNWRFQMFNLTYGTDGVPSFTAGMSFGSKIAEVDGFSSPGSILFDSAGNSYISDTYLRNIRKFGKDFSFEQTFPQTGSMTSTASVNPMLVGSAAGETVVVAGSDTANVYSSSGEIRGALKHAPYVSPAQYPDDYFSECAAMGADGTILVASWTAGSLYLGKPDYSKLSTANFVTPELVWQKFIGPDYAVKQPKSIAAFDDGGFAVLDSASNSVYILAADGTVTGTFGSNGIGDDQFYRPVSIDIDSSGTIYVADSSLECVKKFLRDGVYAGKILAGIITNSFVSFGVKGAGEEIVVINNSEPVVSRYVRY